MVRGFEWKTLLDKTFEQFGHFFTAAASRNCHNAVVLLFICSFSHIYICMYVCRKVQLLCPRCGQLISNVSVLKDFLLQQTSKVFLM